METYHGYVRTPADAIKLFEACRQGLLPRVQRRLSEKERQSIRSGSVFVWDEREAGMRRWTDGKSWSASRVSGSFLTYREMEGKRGGGFSNTRRGGGGGKTPDSGRGGDEDLEDGEPDGYRYKADGLMKQSFSITTSNGQHLHLISYYSRPHPGQPEILQPSTDPSLRAVMPAKGMYPESSLNEAPGPALTRTPMPQQPYGPPPAHYQQPPPGPPGPYPPYMHHPHPGYPSWPPSPMATPPYGQHYTVAPPGAGYPQQAPPHVHAAGSPAHYSPHPYASASPHPSSYDRAPLPLPNPSNAAAAPRQAPPTTLAPYNHPAHPGTSPHLSYARMKQDSPHSPHLVLPDAKSSMGLDPRRAGPGSTTSAPGRFSHGGPLPAISTAIRTTPPPRHLSASPPRSSHSDSNPTSAGIPSASGNKASLSALLHPTPSNSEPNSANPESNSAGNSPRHPPGSAGGGGSGQPLMASGLGAKGMQISSVLGEDQRALSVLDRKFAI